MTDNNSQVKQMKVKKCVECGTEHKINYIYTHYKSKKHFKNLNKKNISHLVDDNRLVSNYKHLLNNVDNILDVCNHLKTYINEQFNKINSNNLIS
jgi:fibrillarin-like rRNA methylase